MNKKKYYQNRPKISSREATRIYSKLIGKNKILDVGCGTGMLGEYKPDSVMLYGVDNDEEALKLANSKYERTYCIDINQNIDVFDMVDFNGVILKDILEHIPNPINLMNNIFKVTSGDVRIYASVPTPCYHAWNDYTHIRPFTKRSIKDLFEDAGFKIKKTSYLRGIKGVGYFGLTGCVSFVLGLPFMKRFATGLEVVAVKDND